MIFAQVVIAIVTISIFKINSIKAALYEFVIDNDEIFETCPTLPGSNGIHDMFDSSDLVIEYADGQIHCSGNLTVVWDVKPSDRIQLRAEIYRYQRGAWQLTHFTVLVKDFCDVMYKEDTMWYNGWTHAILESDRLCLNNKGHIFHHDDFTVDTKLNMMSSVEGRTKLVVNFEAYDENNQKNPSSICLEMPGEFIRSKG